MQKSINGSEAIKGESARPAQLGQTQASVWEDWGGAGAGPRRGRAGRLWGNNRIPLYLPCPKHVRRPPISAALAPLLPCTLLGNCCNFPTTNLRLRSYQIVSPRNT